MIYRITLLFVVVTLLNSCSSLDSKTETNSKTFNAFLDNTFDEIIARDPMRQTLLGMKTNYHKLNDISEKKQKEDYQLNRTHLKQLKKFNFKKLNKKDQISYLLLEDKLKTELKEYQYRFFKYLVTQKFGVHSRLPVFMTNYHSIESYKEAQDYITRIKTFKPFMDELIINLKNREKKGMIPPKFAFPKVTDQITNLLKGYPFEKGNDNLIYADFKKKIKDLKDNEKEILIIEIEQALLLSYQSAYQNFLKYWQTLKQKADDKDGIWKFKGGDKYYSWLVKKHTTTDLTPKEIHELGLKEMDRIHKEMEVIKNKLNFKGSLNEFFKFITTHLNNRSLYYSNTDNGRQAYLKKTNQLIQQMYKALPKYFNLLPKAKVTVKRIEPFREKSAGLAFYTRPTPGGKTPGIYYINLFDMKNSPAFQMEALTYHEAIPGHHLQIALTMEQENLPKFRKFLGAHHTAFVEGWGLYAEKLAKDMGFYKNLYSQLGQLTMELRRAGRLVVDTGIHYKKWTRRQAIDFLLKNTPDVETEHISSIERYIVMPGQALAYTIGMIKIMELREKAKTELKEKFDIKDFHDHILQNGSLPLSTLEELITQWIAEKKSNTN